MNYIDLDSALATFDGLFVSMWDSEKGYEIIKNNNKALEDLKQKDNTNLFAILQSHIVEEDLESYRIFADKLRRGVTNRTDYCPVKENRLRITLRLKQDDLRIYHKMESFIQKNEKGEIIRVVTVVVPMDSEEIYRENLALNTTNDRSHSNLLTSYQELLSRNPDDNYAVIQFDIAKFKAINSVYGEEMGDDLIRFIVESLKILCNENQIYVRLSADVFMIVTPYEHDEDIIHFIHKINNSLTNYQDLKYRLVFGVSKITDKTAKLRTIGDQAAIARQRAKKDVLEYICFYEDDMNKSILDGKFIEDHVEEAIYNNEFVMYLQPKYSIEKNEIVGAESLVRWFQKDRGMIPPDQFIPILEMNGYIKEMDAFIWEEACKTLRRWLDLGIDNIPISVNVSRVHLNHSYFIELLNNLVEEYQIPKHLLEIEITESANTAGRIMEQIDRLKASGYTLLMDDFGSGYSSLNTLKDTKFDVVKIDRGFLQDFIDSDRGQKIVQHTISMTKSIGLDLVAEGVETLEQANFLADCGCDVAQGFYYAKPMSVADMEKLMGLNTPKDK